MTKNATVYTVLVNGEAQDATFSKKDKGIAAVEAAAKSDKRANIQLVTGSGKVVAEVKGVKTIKMSPPYTRVVELPEGAKIPSEMRVAYTRNRKKLAITHHFTAPEGPYAVVNFETGKVLAREIPTTREAGAFCKTV